MSIAGVITTRDQVRWIADAVRSLLPEVDELVVVDDGSRDGTWERLEELALEHPFRLLRHETSLGVSEGFAHAIAVTSADVLLIQGGDDRSVPGRGGRSAAALADPAVMLVHSAPEVIDAEDQRLPDDAAAEFQDAPDDPLHHLFHVGNYICAPSVALRRADYLRYGGFPRGNDLLQDYALWLELAAVGRLHAEPQPLVQYRKHASNLSREYQGVDTARRRRYAAELIWVQDRFLDAADEATLARLAVLPDPRDPDALDRDERAMLVRLVSDRRPLVRRGLADLFTRVAVQGVQVLARYGMERGDLDRLAAVADHENLAELGRARAVLAALRADDGAASSHP